MSKPKNMAYRMTNCGTQWSSEVDVSDKTYQRNEFGVLYAFVAFANADLPNRVCTGLTYETRNQSF